MNVRRSKTISHRIGNNDLTTSLPHYGTEVPHLWLLRVQTHTVHTYRLNSFCLTQVRRKYCHNLIQRLFCFYHVHESLVAAGIKLFSLNHLSNSCPLATMYSTPSSFSTTHHGTPPGSPSLRPSERPNAPPTRAAVESMSPPM